MRTLVIRNLFVQVDAYGEDAAEEAREVVRQINNVATKLGGDPLVDFDLQGSADIQAEYVEQEEG